MTVRIMTGDCREVLRTLADESVHCVVTSPPYWGLRDYGIGKDAFGLDPTYQLYVDNAVTVFRDVRRVLRKDGTLWLNLGDSYATGAGRVGERPGGGSQGDNWQGATTSPNRMPQPGLKPKDLVGIPWRVAFALQADGWYLRQDIIWSKPNPMPESVRDRCTKAHEYLFLLSKSERYYYDADAIKESSVDDIGISRGGSMSRFGRTEQLISANAHRGDREYASDGTRNRRSVWDVATQPFPEAHFATFPPALIEPCIKAGCPLGGTVLDPFGGAGTTGLVADRLQRNAILIELNPAYAAMARKRITDDAPLLAYREAAESHPDARLGALL
jgi:DNA modification methylase